MSIYRYMNTYTHTVSEHIWFPNTSGVSAENTPYPYLRESMLGVRSGEEWGHLSSPIRFPLLY